MNLAWTTMVLVTILIAMQSPALAGEHKSRHLHRDLEAMAGRADLQPAEADLLLTLESGDVLVRSARRANKDLAAPSDVDVDAGAGASGAASKRARNNNNNNKKSNRNLSADGGAARNDKKFSAAVNGQQKQAPQHGSPTSKGEKQQKKLLKSQQHQSHGKRAGLKAKAGAAAKEKAAAAGAPEGDKTCRYAKSEWSECDVKTNMRTRTLTLKQGAESTCSPTKTMQKKCKKACRYERGLWSECQNGEMTRQDKLKTSVGGSPKAGETGGPNNNGSANCEAVRVVNKKCNVKRNGGGGGKGGRHGGAKQANNNNNNNKERKNKASRRSQPSGPLPQQQQQQQLKQQ